MADEVAAPVAEAPGPAAAPIIPQPPESISEKMARLGWEKDLKHDDNPDTLGARARAEATDETEAEPEKPAKVEKAEKKKPAAAEPADPLAAKREKLQELIGELGMAMEDGRVTTAERAAFRAERREAREALAKLEQETIARLEARTKAAEEADQKNAPRFDKLGAFEKAVEEGDHEAMAKAAGFDSYDKLQEHIIALKADPAYRRLRALESQVETDRREKREREERDAKAAEEREAKAAQEAEQAKNNEARSNYMRDLSKTMSQSTDPLVKAMHDDPSFVSAIFRVQQEHYDGEKTITPEQALRTAARGTSAPIMAELRKLHDRLAPIFSTPQPSASTAVAAVKAGVGRSPQPDKPPAPSKAPQTERDWKISAARRLEEAAAEEKAQRRGKSA